MLGFGLGTLPSMLLAGNAFNYLKEWAQAPVIRTAAGILIMAFGLYNGISVFTQQHHLHGGHTDLSPTVLQHSGATELTRVPAIWLSVA
jgi:sulfite exporter TauE/SafE